MSSTTMKNDAFQNDIEESEEDQEEISERQIDYRRPSLVPRQISFSQRRATTGEIILVLLPYFVLIVDIFIFFLLRGFKFPSTASSVASNHK